MKTVSVDLDGVLAQYDGWKGPEHIGPPIEGAGAFLERLVDAGYLVAIYTTRGKTPEEAQLLSEWIETNLPEEVKQHLLVTDRKMPSMVYLDDRAICFKGTFPSVAEIENFKPWWQQS